MVRFELKTPAETAVELSQRVKTLRLQKKWTRATLAKRSGVPAPTLRKFEDTGKLSLESFLKLVNALGRLYEIESLLQPPSLSSFQDLEKRAQPLPKRGTI